MDVFIGLNFGTLCIPIRDISNNDTSKIEYGTIDGSVLIFAFAKSERRFFVPSFVLSFSVYLTVLEDKSGEEQFIDSYNTYVECIQGDLFMLEHFFKSLVATVSDPYQCNRITDALAAAGIKFYCKSKDVNRHNTFDQARIGTLGIKPRYVTEVFVDKENADMALHIIHTLS